MADKKTDEKQESRVVLPVDPTRRTEIDKQRVPMSARPYRLLAMVKQDAVVRVAKAPWYLLGLQELLAYFHPVISGVLVPFLYILLGAIVLPYIDRGNIEAKRPAERKTAVVLFTLLCGLGLMVTFVGVFFRGPGYSVVTPFLPFFDNFTNGLHFAL